MQHVVYSPPLQTCATLAILEVSLPDPTSSEVPVPAPVDGLTAFICAATPAGVLGALQLACAGELTNVPARPRSIRGTQDRGAEPGIMLPSWMGAGGEIDPQNRNGKAEREASRM